MVSHFVAFRSLATLLSSPCLFNPSLSPPSALLAHFISPLTIRLPHLSMFNKPRLPSPTFQCMHKLTLEFDTSARSLLDYTIFSWNKMSSIPHECRFPHSRLEKLCATSLNLFSQFSLQPVLATSPDAAPKPWSRRSASVLFVRSFFLFPFYPSSVVFPSLALFPISERTPSAASKPVACS